MQGRDVIALTAEFQHEREGVLAAGKGHEHAVLSGHEALFPNASVHLLRDEVEEAVGAEGGVVAGKGDNGACVAAAAFHAEDLVADGDVSGCGRGGRRGALHRNRGIR